MINVCFLKLFNKYLITLEKIITPSENPSPNTAIDVIEPNLLKIRYFID